jgi:monoamine oxidase
VANTSGIAGLTAAREIAKAGRSVILLEARGRVGGRVLNHRLGGGEVAELGGMFTGPDAGPDPGARP